MLGVWDLDKGLEKNWIDRCKQGKYDAFEELVKKYEKKIYNLAYRMTGSHEDANDLAQESFIRAFRSIGSYRGDAKFSTWLYRIATNVCLDELRRRKKQRLESLDEPVQTEDGEIEKDIADWSHDPEESYEKKEIQKIVQKGIAKLPEDQKAVIILRDMQERSYDEIAYILNLSLGTVKSRINRGRKALKSYLKKDGELFLTKTRLME